MKPFLLVSGDFVTTGGMDRANHALAAYLARQGHETHLVAHRVAEDLLVQPHVHWHRVPKVRDSYFLSTPLLERAGRRWAKQVTRAGGYTLVNGGNCLAKEAANWVHYVHALGPPADPRGTLGRVTNRVRHRVFAALERTALRRARVVITNSERTRQDLIDRLRLPPERIQTVYYGSDARLFRPVSTAERAALRARLGWPGDVPFVVFVGALGDRRKGFDTLFAAWQTLSQASDWDAHLAAIGTGTELPRWQELARAAKLSDRLHFLGFRRDVPAILPACDLLVAPTRYEAYGLGVHEALCCGLPALVSQQAGVAERYPAKLHELLLPDPEDATDLAQRLWQWRARRPEYQQRVAEFATELRAYSWDDMAARIVALMTARC